MKAFLLILGTLTVFAVLLIGCGDNYTTTGAAVSTGAVPNPPATETKASTTGPCTALSKADIEAIMGDPVGQPKHVDTSVSRECGYNATTDGRSAGIIIKPCSISDYTGMATGSAVDGIGTQASWNNLTLTVHTKDDACLVASGGGSKKGADLNSDAAALETAKAVALKVIDKVGNS